VVVRGTTAAYQQSISGVVQWVVLRPLTGPGRQPVLGEVVRYLLDFCEHLRDWRQWHPQGAGAVPVAWLAGFVRDVDGAVDLPGRVRFDGVVQCVGDVLVGHVSDYGAQGDIVGYRADLGLLNRTVDFGGHYVRGSLTATRLWAFGRTATWPGTAAPGTCAAVDSVPFAAALTIG